MASIIEIEGELYIALSMTNYEDMGSCSYDREYKLYPYSSDLPDDLTIDLSSTSVTIYRQTGLRNTVTHRPDKIPYEQYGYSRIRGKETIMLERKYPEPIKQPTK